MKKSELVSAVAESTGVSKSQVQQIIDSTIETIISTVGSGEKILLPGFLSFEVQDKAASTGRNPATGATIQIPARKVVKVKLGKTLKESVA